MSTRGSAAQCRADFWIAKAWDLHELRFVRQERSGRRNVKKVDKTSFKNDRSDTLLCMISDTAREKVYVL